MKRREAEQLVEAALSRLADTHVRRSGDMWDGMVDAGETRGVRAMKKIWRLAQHYATHTEGAAAEASDQLTEIFVERGAERGQAEAEAASLAKLVRALVVEFTDPAQLTRATRLIAADVTDGRQEHPKRARAALDAWRALDAARTAAMPDGDDLERLMAEGPLALERHRRKRGHELGLHDLEARFVGAWVRCLGP